MNVGQTSAKIQTKNLQPWLSIEILNKQQGLDKIALQELQKSVKILYQTSECPTERKIQNSRKFHGVFTHSFPNHFLAQHTLGEIVFWCPVPFCKPEGTEPSKFEYSNLSWGSLRDWHHLTWNSDGQKDHSLEPLKTAGTAHENCKG